MCTCFRICVERFHVLLFFPGFVPPKQITLNLVLFTVNLCTLHLPGHIQVRQRHVGCLGPSAMQAHAPQACFYGYNQQARVASAHLGENNGVGHQQGSDQVTSSAQPSLRTHQPQGMLGKTVAIKVDPEMVTSMWTCMHSHAA